MCGTKVKMMMTLPFMIFYWCCNVHFWNELLWMWGHFSYHLWIETVYLWACHHLYKLNMRVNNWQRLENCLPKPRIFKRIVVSKCQRHQRFQKNQKPCIRVNNIYIIQSLISFTKNDTKRKWLSYIRGSIKQFHENIFDLIPSVFTFCALICSKWAINTTFHANVSLLNEW